MLNLQQIALSTVTADWLAAEMSTNKVKVKDLAPDLDIPPSTLYAILADNMPANSQARKVKLALYLHFKLLDYERRIREE